MKTLPQALAIIESRLPVEDINIKRRVQRAYDICISHGYTISLVENQIAKNAAVYRVYKASTSLLEDSSAMYIVDDTSCTCPDFEKVRAGLCKHRIAVMLVKEMQS